MGKQTGESRISLKFSEFKDLLAVIVAAVLICVAVGNHLGRGGDPLPVVQALVKGGPIEQLKK